MTMPDPTPAPSGLSALFSLSQAAASAPPMPVNATSLSPAPVPALESASAKDRAARRHRRLSSSEHNVLAPVHPVTRRRPSDVREAGALLALSALSLSSSGLSAPTPTTNLHSHSHQQGVDIPAANREAQYDRGQGMGAIASSVPTPYMGREVDVDVEEDFDDGASVAESVSSRPGGKPKSSGAATKGSRKRGTIFQCESCTKVYRHPSCLVKHRWEHSPHWREASKYLLSKHQQVQMLEAAAILSHLDPGSSLPEDRSLWPSYLSGGLLPPPSTSAGGLPASSARSSSVKANAKSSAAQPQPISSSVPARRGARALSDRPVSTGTSAGTGQGPKLYDYNLKSQGGGSSTGSLTQIRPGLLGRPTAPASLGSADVNDEQAVFAKGHPMGVPVPGMPTPEDAAEVYTRMGYREPSHPAGGSFSSVGASASADASVGAGGWSVPHSELRSVSESVSGSGEEEEDESNGSYVDGERAHRSYRNDVGVVDPEVPAAGYGFSGRRRALKQETTDADAIAIAEEDEWGVEVDMDMEVDF